jgi:hypothetical protein
MGRHVQVDDRARGCRDVCSRMGANALAMYVLQ